MAVEPIGLIMREAEEESVALLKFIQDYYPKFTTDFKMVYPILIQVLDKDPSEQGFSVYCLEATTKFLMGIGFSALNSTILAKGLKDDVVEVVRETLADLISQNVDRPALKKELEDGGFGWDADDPDSFDVLFDNEEEKSLVSDSALKLDIAVSSLINSEALALKDRALKREKLKDIESRGLLSKLKGMIPDKIKSALETVNNSFDNAVTKVKDKVKSTTNKAVKDIEAKAKKVISVIKDAADKPIELVGKWKEFITGIVEVDSKKEPGPQDYNLEEPEVIEQKLEILDLKKNTFDKVVEYKAPKNWFDKLPDWPPQTYLGILKDQTVNVSVYIHEGLIDQEDVEAELESRKYPYRVKSPRDLNHMIASANHTISMAGNELTQTKIFERKDLTGGQTVEDLYSIPVDYTSAVAEITTTMKEGYKSTVPPFWKNDTLRDDLTDQQNYLINMLDMEKLKDEFLRISQKIIDQESDSPSLFADEQEASYFETEKNIVLANYYQYKANSERINLLNNEIENENRRFLSETMMIQQNITLDSYEWNWRTRYLREKLLAWYNEVDDPETSKWGDFHWVSGQVGYITALLTVGDYEWYDNIIKSLESNLQRLDDIEAMLDIIDSIENIAESINRYKTSIEENEALVEGAEHYDDEFNTIYSDQVFDQSMFNALLGKVAPIGIVGGPWSAVRAELRSLRWANLSILEKVRVMSPTTFAFPIIWSHFDALKNAVIEDIEIHLNTLIMDKRGDHETLGWHSSPSHLELHIHDQLDLIYEWIISSVVAVIDEQACLPKVGLERLDSMLNKINEIRKWGPMCNLPEYFHWAIDNINQAEAIYDGIWSDVFDCWEREYIMRNWRILTEHHMDIMDAWPYGVPLFPALCMSRHLGLLLDAIPIEYRDIDINWLARNARRNFKNLTSWLTSILYAVGLKWTALATVVNDTSLNGNDANIENLEKINDLHFKNLILKEEVEKAIKEYDVPGEFLNKRKLDEVIGASELAPRYYSNEAMLNRGSEVGLAKNRAMAIDVTGIENNENAITQRSAYTVTNTDTLTSFVGTIEQLMPWHYGDAEWESTHTPIKPPIIEPPEPETYIQVYEFKDVVGAVVEKPEVSVLPVEYNKYVEEVQKIKRLHPKFKKFMIEISPMVDQKIQDAIKDSGYEIPQPLDLNAIVSEYCAQNGIPTDASPSSLMTAALSAYLQAHGVPAPLANIIAKKVVDESGLGEKADLTLPSATETGLSNGMDVKSIVDSLPEKVRQFLNK